MCQLYDRITYIIFIGVLIFYSLGNSIKNLLFFLSSMIFVVLFVKIKFQLIQIYIYIYIYIETKICKPFKDKIKKQINLKKTKEEEEALFKLSVFYCFSHNPFMGLRTISILTLLLDFVE
jgi:predicted membrane protein